MVTSSQQAKGKSTSVEAGQRTLSSMLPKKSPAATDPPAEPADSQQMVLHTSPALALIERKEAHAKGLVAPHMPTGERYPPSLIEFVMNWNKAEFVYNDDLPEKFGPAEFSTQMNTAAKEINLTGRMMEVCRFSFTCCR